MKINYSLYFTKTIKTKPGNEFPHLKCKKRKIQNETFLTGNLFLGSNSDKRNIWSNTMLQLMKLLIHFNKKEVAIVSCKYTMNFFEL